MWLRIVSAIYTGAKSIGLDKKIKGWVQRKLAKKVKKIVSVAQSQLDKVDAIKEELSKTDVQL